MIKIDGSIGEGGGQVLRSALTLSMITGQPFRIENIRANRSKPGLMRQHLTSVNAARDVCAGDVLGASVGSDVIEFLPGSVSGGEYHFSIGTAGSTTLVLQTVLPALITASEPSVITIEGGTHNIYAPSVHFLGRAFLPLIERMGPTVVLELKKHGFYPAGGGRISVDVNPVDQLEPIDLLERGDVVEQYAVATVAGLSGEIAKRELAVIGEKLGWSEGNLHIELLDDEVGPGNILTVEIVCKHAHEVFTGFGERGVSAERVASRTAGDVRRYLAAGVPVWRHLADQLILPLAIAGGGSFRTGPLSQHTETNAAVIERFLDVKVHMAPADDRTVTVRVHS